MSVLTILTQKLEDRVNKPFDARRCAIEITMFLACFIVVGWFGSGINNEND